MSNPVSLTEAAKLAATSDTSPTDRTSLTEEVKKAAKGGVARVISFPTGPDARHGVAWGARRISTPAPEFDKRAFDKGAAPAHPVVSEPVERRSAAPVASRLDPDPGSVRPEPALAESKVPRRRLLPLGVKLVVAVAVLTLLALLATASVVGPDRPALATTQKRVALVIGNSAYRHTPQLDNPRNDATDMAAVLRKLGFRVIEGYDLDKAGLERKVREFTAAAQGAELAVFFYAGHGLHVSGNNYLVPVDAQLSTVTALDAELVRLDVVHRAVEQQAAASILFFDACRDNPLSANLARAMGTRSAEIGRGLAFVEGGANTLISFSTQPGKMAFDGNGRNSPYSRALARHLSTSNDDIGAVLIAVRKDVMRDTDRKQVPWEHTSLTAPVYFNPAPEAAPSTHVADLRSREAFDAWTATKDTTSIAVLEAFITRFRGTFYVELARFRIEELKKGIIPLLPPPGDGGAPLPSQ